MLIIMQIEKEEALDMRERFKRMAALNRELSTIYHNVASKTDALKKAIMYEHIWKSIDGALQEVEVDPEIERELKALADKHGAAAVIAAIQQCFKDEEVQTAVKGFTGSQDDGEKVQ